jgi:hypothetical protein
VNQIGELDPDTVIWRYLTRRKFVSLIELRAVWFARLGIFEDAEEGTTPELTRQQINSQLHEMEGWFPDEERKRQIRRSLEDNERFGRDLIVASCWFIGEHESKDMWAEYAKDGEGVVIKSTVGALMRALVQTIPKKWWIGKVRYVDLSAHDGMNPYEGHQAHLRAFLKGMKYSHENELRVATMNFVAAGCLNPDGSPQNEKQRRGLIDTSNGPGVYVQANLSALMTEIRVAPMASDGHRAEIEFLMTKAGIRVPVARSELTPRTGFRRPAPSAAGAAMPATRPGRAT